MEGENFHNFANFNFNKFEAELYDKLYELQFKTESLEETQNELTKKNLEIYRLESTLEDEKRSRKELENQVKTLTEVLSKLEDDRVKYQSEKVQLKINSESSRRERDSLIEQARISHVENMNLKQQVNLLERDNQLKDKENRSLHLSFNEYKNNVSVLISTFTSNLKKLEDEQMHLNKVFHETAEVYKCLQAVGLCAHAIHKKNQVKIEKLEKRIGNLSLQLSSNLNLKSSGESDKNTGKSVSQLGILQDELDKALKDVEVKMQINEDLHKALEEMMKDSRYMGATAELKK